MANNKPSLIPNSLRNASSNFPYVAESVDIYDKNNEKSQEQINASVQETLADHQNAINALDSQNYLSYVAEDGDTLADILPATGEVNTIYRVGSWDYTLNDGAGGYDETKYSEYAWNGTQYLPMDVKDMQLGSAEDFEEPNATKRAKIPTVGAVADVHGSYNGNPEYIKVIVDSEGRIIAGVRIDGSIYIAKDIDNATINRLRKDVEFFNSIFSVVDNPEFIQAITDSEKRVISCRDYNGVLHENVGIESPKMTTELLNLSENGLIKLYKDIGKYINIVGKNLNQSALLLREYIINHWSYYFNTIESSDPEAVTITSYDVESYLEEKIKEVPTDGKHFIVFTDTHWIGDSQKSIKLINYVKDRLGIKNVLFMGDAVQSPSTSNAKYQAAQDLSVFCEEFFSAFGTDGIYVQGNHDSNFVGYLNAREASEDPDSVDSADYLISDEQVYHRTVKNIENNVVFDTEGIERLSVLSLTDEQLREAVHWVKMHYYYDDDVNKIRYIVLETGDMGPTHFNIFECPYYYVINLQLDFVASALLSKPDDYDAVVTGHQIGTADQIYFSSLQQLISLFKTKSGRNIRRYINSQYANAIAYLGSEYKYYDFTASKNEGKVFIISGHYHQDRVFINQTEDGSYVSRDYEIVDNIENDAILSIWVDRDNYLQPGIPVNEYCIANQMELNTVTENLFDVVTIKDDSILCTRFGAGNNRVINY